MDNGSEASARPELMVSGQSRGTNQIGVRLYNERLVLSLIREHKSLPKAEVARLTGLSPQTISGIVNQLTEDGLLLKGRPQRGRVGQPSVPYSLNPEGAYFVGMKIGRRSSDVVLLDFVGRVLRKFHEPHPYSTPEQTLALIRRGTGELVAGLTPAQHARISGFGIASPFELWNWEPQFGAPQSALEAWRTADILGEARRLSPWPVYLHNDGTAACAAELVLGEATTSADFLYIFIGSFIGGGVVLNHHLYPGRNRYAGAIGPMPIPIAGKPGFQQVLRSASLYVLGEEARRSRRRPHRADARPGQLGRTRRAAGGLAGQHRQGSGADDHLGRLGHRLRNHRHRRRVPAALAPAAGRGDTHRACILRHAGRLAVFGGRRLNRLRRPRNRRRLPRAPRQLHQGPRRAVQGVRTGATRKFGPVDRI